MRPEFRSALFNLALLLSDAGRPLEAVPFLTRLVHHHPDHVKALILLGDIYINNIEDLDEAEKVRVVRFPGIRDGGIIARGLFRCYDEL